MSLSPRPVMRALVAVVVAAGVAVGAVSVGPAGAQVAAGGAAEGWVRLGHFAPGEGTVDVLIDGTIAATDIGSGTVSPYVRVAAGTHRIRAVTAGAATLVDVETGVPADGSVTVGVVTTRDGVGVQVYDDSLAPPPPGQALVRFIHTVPDIPAVDIAVVGGPTLATGVGYPDATPYIPVTPGTYDVQVLAAGTTDVLVNVAAWKVAAGSEATVVVNRSASGALSVVPLLDAGGVTVMPVGGAATGFGGLAVKAGGMEPEPRPIQSVLVAAVAGVVARSISNAADRIGAGSEVGLARRARPTTETIPVVSGTNVNTRAVGDPVAVIIPSLNVASSLVPLGIDADGSVAVPATADQAGWFADGPRPGEAGAAVILGHVDSKNGPGVFADLRNVGVGAEVIVTTASGDESFTVTEVQQVPKDQFPSSAVYDSVPEPELRLITCGGSFDRSTGHYRDNVVVYLDRGAVAP